MGNTAAARNLYERGIKRCPDHAALWQALAKLESEAGEGARAQARLGFHLALAREPNGDELDLTSQFIERNGLPAFCRVLFNSNEFLYIN